VDAPPDLFFVMSPVAGLNMSALGLSGGVGGDVMQSLEEDVFMTPS
jgi:hypothetical protein